MTKTIASAEEISALIAVQMVGRYECDCVSAPAIRRCAVDENGCNWEAWDWRGDPDVVITCRVAMLEAIDVLMAYYVLVPID